MIKPIYKYKLREINNELIIQLLETAYWVKFYFDQAAHHTELHPVAGWQFMNNLGKELGDPIFNQEEINEEEFLKELETFLSAMEEANEAYDS